MKGIVLGLVGLVGLVGGPLRLFGVLGLVGLVGRVGGPLRGVVLGLVGRVGDPLARSLLRSLLESLLSGALLSKKIKNFVVAKFKAIFARCIKYSLADARERRMRAEA